jgi:hypothetical protein
VSTIIESLKILGFSEQEYRDLLNPDNEEFCERRIKKAYHKAILNNHPDHAPDKNDSTKQKERNEQTQLIVGAYRFLQETIEKKVPLHELVKVESEPATAPNNYGNRWAQDVFKSKTEEHRLEEFLRIFCPSTSVLSKEEEEIVRGYTWYKRESLYRIPTNEISPYHLFLMIQFLSRENVVYSMRESVTFKNEVVLQIGSADETLRESDPQIIQFHKVFGHTVFQSEPLLLTY